MNLMLLFSISLIFSTCINAQSWLTCPPSFNPVIERTGETIGPCDGDINKAPTTTLKAGDRLKVGWPSMNRGGGFVRLSLVPANLAKEQTEFDRNVIKQVCFGKDSRDYRYAYGNCIHPCNGRPSCEWARNGSDIERYDTTITVPVNLADGTYVLQFMAITGNTPSKQYSCSKLQITGGDIGISCSRLGSIPQTQCTTAFGPSVSSLLTGATVGGFCYGPNGDSNVDGELGVMPINADCDPRTTCKYSPNLKLCKAEVPIGVNPLYGKRVCFSVPSNTCNAINLPKNATRTCSIFKSKCEPYCRSVGASVTVNECYNRLDLPLGVLPYCECGLKNSTAPVLKSTVDFLCNGQNPPTPSQTPTPDDKCPAQVKEGSACSSKDNPRCSGTEIAVCKRNRWRINKCRRGTCRMRRGKPVCQRWDNPCGFSKRSFVFGLEEE